MLLPYEVLPTDTSSTPSAVFQHINQLLGWNVHSLAELQQLEEARNTRLIYRLQLTEDAAHLNGYIFFEQQKGSIGDHGRLPIAQSIEMNQITSQTLPHLIRSTT